MPRFFSPPNQLTLLRILLTPVFVALYLSPEPSFRLWSLAVFVIAMLTDWYDGWVARRWGFITKWGSHFDPMADKIFISAAFFAFVFMGLVPAWTVWIIVIRDVGVTILRSYSELKGIPFHTSMSAKTKTFMQFVALYYILLASVGSSSLPSGSWGRQAAGFLYSTEIMYWMMTALAVFTVVTAIQYIYDNRILIRSVFDTLPREGSPATRPNVLMLILGSGFLTGYAPVASGTAGSALAAALYFCIPGFEEPIILVPLTLALFVIGIRASDQLEQYYGHDPSQATIDEIVGMWLSFILVPKTLALTVAGFLVFRILDIIKPFPAKRFEQQTGGFGIMMDDVVAGVYTNILLQILAAVIGMTGSG